MLFSAVCLALAAAIVLLEQYTRKRRFDPDELRIIRGLAERTRKDQFHPFG